MMATIEPGPDQVRIVFDDSEAALLRDLVDQMTSILAEEVEVEGDVVDRLFPAAYADPDDARAFAELVGDELRSGKLAAARTVRGALATEDASIASENVEAWLTVLTDLRLALGTRLEVTEEKMSAEIDPAAPQAPAMSVLHWLGWIQEMLIEASTTDTDNRGER